MTIALHSIKGLGQTCLLLFQQKLNKTNLLEGSEVEYFWKHIHTEMDHLTIFLFQLKFRSFK